MATTTTTEGAKVKATVLDLSKALSADVKISAKGEVTLSDGIFEKHLPDGITPDIVKAVTAYEGEFIAAAAHAVGHHAVDTFKKHKGVESIAVTVPMAGKNTLDLSLERSRTFPGMVRDGVAGPEVVKYATMDVKYTVHEAAGSRGQLKQVRNSVNEAALAAYGA